MRVSYYDFIFLVKGAGFTILLSLGTILMSIPVAVLLGLLRAIKIKNVVFYVVQAIITICITAIRGTPLMLLMIFVFFGLPFMGVNFSPMTAAFFSLSIYSVAYLAEIVRTGIESIAKTQWDGAASLGFNFIQTMRLIILPQAFRIMIPPTVSFFIGLVKDSSLCAVIGVVELARAGRVIVERTHYSLLLFSIVAMIYFIICYPLSIVSKNLERKLSA